MKNILFFNIFALATAFSPFIGESGLNYFFIVLMVCSIFITVGNFFKPDKMSWMLYLLPVTLFVSGILHYDSFRIYSYLYGFLLVIFFITNLYLIKNCRMTIGQYQKMLKILIYTYFFVLLIQQAQYMSGQEDFFNRIYAKEYSFNVLATEPSYAAIVILYLFYTYIKSQEVIHQASYAFEIFKKDMLLWFVFIYEMLTIGSSYGILFLIIFLLTFLKEPKYFAGIFVFSIFLIFLALEINFLPLQRILDTIGAINFRGDDYSDLILADHSAAVRIIPLLIFLKDWDLYTLFGNGMDFSAELFPSLVIGVEEGARASWFLPSFIIDHGIVNSLLVIIIIYKNGIDKVFSFSSVILFLTLLNTSFNTQLFWLVITLLAMNKYISNNVNSTNEQNISNVYLNFKDVKWKLNE